MPENSRFPPGNRDLTNTALLATDRIDGEQILAALTALRRGDHSVRLPRGWTGIAGKVADTFNKVVVETAGRPLEGEVLATLSHQLRSPLNATLGWTTLLRTGKLDASDTARALEVIERNVKLQVKLIDDLLDVSRSISGKIRLNVRPLDLAPVVVAAVEVLRLSADQKEIGLRLDLAGEAWVLGDPHRLGQVVRNLLSNAIKFTPKGGSIRLELRCSRPDVELIVADTGEGISPEALPHVFESFRQEDSSSTRSHAGLGLGLAIVSRLVELHHGVVQAESNGKGEGATFRVRLPSSASDVSPIRLDGLRILVVDDERDGRDLLGTMLERRGAEVRRAESAEQALGLLDGFHPDVLISDIAMPGEDGYSLVRRMRARPSAADSRVPALALTSFAQLEDRSRALAAGFQMHMAKPFQPARLIAAVAELARAGSH